MRRESGKVISDKVAANVNEQEFSVTVQTKLMQNYRVGSIIQGGANMCSTSCIGEAGYEDALFVTDSRGEIYCLKQDSGSTTGMVGEKIGMHGNHVALGRDSNGKLIIFSSQAEQLYCMQEKKKGSFTFNSSENVAIPLPVNASSIEAICVKQIKEGMSIAVFYKTQLDAAYYVAYGIWKDQAPEFRLLPSTFGNTACIWLGSQEEDLALAVVDNIVATYHLASKKIETYSCDTILRPIAIKNVIGQAGEDIIFAIIKNGKNADLSELKLNQDKKNCEVIPLSKDKYFTSFDICKVQEGEIHLLGIATDNVLYHAVKQIDESQTTSDLTPISSGIAQVSCCGSYAKELTAFIVGTTQNRVAHFIYELETGNWNRQYTDLPTDTEHIEVYSAYTSEVMAYDPAGALLIATPVEIWASELTKIETRSGVYYVGPHNKILTSTDTRGVLSISQETNMLASSEIIIHLPAVMVEDETLVIKQFEGVQTKLYQVDSNQLMNAKKADGTYLLEDTYRTAETTTSLANAISKCMGMVEQVPVGHKSMNTRGKAKGVYKGKIIQLDEIRKLRVPENPQHWSLDFSGNQMCYQDLSLEEANNQILLMKQGSTNVQGIFSWITKIGDFFRGVVDKVIDVVKMVVTTVVEGIKVAFDFIVDGVKYVFEQIVTFVEEAFDVVEIIFDKVKVAFKELFQWLGFIFNWDDILRSKEVISYLMQQQLAFIQGSVEGTKEIVMKGIDGIQSKVSTIFDWAIKNIAGKESLLGYIKENTLDDPEMEEAYSNNFLMEQFEKNSPAIESIVYEALEQDSVLDEFIKELEKLIDFTESQEAFTEAIAYFKQIGKAPDELFNNLLAGLFKIIEGIVQATLSATQAVLGALFDVVEYIVGAITKLLTTEIKIPFISPFYKMISGNSALTLLDLASLIIAVPATIFFKIAKNKAPFPDSASIASFKEQVNAERMLAAAGFKVTNTLKSCVGAASEVVQELCKVFGAVSSFFFFSFAGITDCIKDAPSAIQIMPLIAEFCWQGFSTPWIASDGAPDCFTEDGQSKVNWIYVNLGLIIDGAFYILTKKYADSAEDPGRLTTAIYGLLHIIPTTLACLHAKPVAIAANAISPIVEISKLLLLTEVSASTEGISIACAGVIDGMAAIAMPILVTCS